MRYIIKIIFIAFIAMFLFVGCDGADYYSPVDPSATEEVLFTVPRGASTKRIGGLLHEAGLVQNANAFVAQTKSLEQDGKLQAGDYMLSKAMPQEDIIRKIASGDVFIDTFKFTIPEGFEFTMIVDKLESEGLIDRETFIEVSENHPFEYRFLEEDRNYEWRLEGFLFPATYELKAGSDEVAIVKAMLDQFNRVFTDEFYHRTLELGMTINEVVTLASIVERESMAAEEFATIASVFHNRLQISQRLESCATIQYALGERKDRLLFVDLEIESPFNTYKHEGLPPAPIASPGKLAIESTLYPEDTNYFFFVVSGDRDGKHLFGTTYNDHMKNKAISDKKLGQ